ncbi:MAG: transcription-repair coupling factor [Spirochaetota bacterium]
MVTLFSQSTQDRLYSDTSFRRLEGFVASEEPSLDVQGLRGSHLALTLAQLAHPMMIVLPTHREAQALAEDFGTFGLPAELLPWWETTLYSESSGISPIHGTRARLLGELALDQVQVVVMGLRAFLGAVPPRDYLRDKSIGLAVGDAIDPPEIARDLERLGYSRVPRVSVRGEFALRGEVLDVFSGGQESAFRVVFEYDEVEAIRSFDVATQTSDEALSSVTIVPTREVMWEDETVSTLKRRLAELPEIRPEQAAAAIERVESFEEAPEILFPLAFDRPGGVVDYLPEGGILVLQDLERLVAGAYALQKELSGHYRTEGHALGLPRPERIINEFEPLAEKAPRRIRIQGLRGESAEALSFVSDPPHSYFGNVSFFKTEVRNRIGAGYEVYIFAGSTSQQHRLESLLQDLPVTVLPESISEGFGLPECKLLVIEENEIFGRRRRIPRSVKQVESKEIDTFVDLTPGDLVVHVNYGIGRFKGIERIEAAGTVRDYIHLEYAGEEFVYLPIEQVNLIQRYIGVGDTHPRLDRIGGKSWEARKGKVQKSVEDLAGRLITLYSRRQKTQGFAFPPDAEWQLDFEANFPYEETPDQLRCIEEVKADMERPTPMDRLVCGDVGYGKTEVAMRAAFKAVSAGKQVAFLAPTTILAEQHFETITERTDGFPIVAAMLSRFVPKSEQRKTLKGLEEGKVDLVIGTHRILQRDVRFKDLGLIIVDEEQRFGVKDKERLKELKTSVDALALTATPIPRTLHMSLLKIRDMSVLNTPPHNRRPIETHIREFSEELVTRAIRRELDRGGQVYYLHNRIDTLENVREFLTRLLPDVVIDTAHGQMTSEELEDIMHRFVHGGSQVLVSTTIIENGIDIPNVNTIIIDRADMYGISQLYQLRGRVGRSERLAYAYLFYPDQRVLSELAMKRLRIISDFTDLGSGFKIALKDMEVRGAGNLLGREQSGDILSVGFDMYLKLLGNALKRLEGGAEEAAPEVYLELDYSGFIPDSYIEEPMEKMEVYKKIAAISDEEELSSVHAELVDRFGPLPEEVESLLSLAEIRILCKQLFISSLKERRGKVEVTFSKVAKVSVDRILHVIATGGNTVRLDPNRPNTLILDTTAVGLREKSEFLRGRLSALV